MKFRLATKNDDKGIRKLLREIELNGMLKIAYHREPSFFKGLEIQGGDYQVFVGTVDEEVKALLTRSIQHINIGSRSYKVAYLSNLRFHPNFRNGISLIRGLRKIEEVTKENIVDFHYATLIDDDKKIKKILAGNRLSMPKHLDLGRIFTYTLPLKKRRINFSSCSFTFEQAHKKNLYEIENFIRTEGENKDFLPFDTIKQDSRLLNISDYFIMRAKNQIVAVCTIKDMSAYKQFTLEDYNKRFGIVRILLNIFLQLKGKYKIPSKKQPIKFIFIGFSLVKDNNLRLFSIFLKFIYSKFSETRYHFLSLAFHEGNQLNSCLGKYANVCYKSRLYLLQLKSDKEHIKNFKERIRNCFVDLLRL